MIINTMEELDALVATLKSVQLFAPIQRSIMLGAYLKDKAAVLRYIAFEAPVHETIRGVPVVYWEDNTDRDTPLIAPLWAEALLCGKYDTVYLASEDIFEALSDTVNVYMDFICAGFAKCGTTTLQDTLFGHHDIYLPAAKETFFFQWYKKGNGTSVMHRRYYHFNRMTRERLSGDIDPSYFRRAKEIHEYFGDDVKLIFMLRNPVAAEYSMFKMTQRFVYREENIEYFRKFGKFSNEMFIDHVKNEVLSGRNSRRFDFAYWINTFLKYYPMEQIKIVLMEDMLKDPKGTLDDIQRFIGVNQIEDYSVLPHSNEGKKVSRGLKSAEINHKIYLMFHESKSQEAPRRYRLFKRFVKPVVQLFTLKNDNLKISPEAKKLVMDYYMPSIKELEKIMDRSLEGVWY